MLFEHLRLAYATNPALDITKITALTRSKMNVR